MGENNYSMLDNNAFRAENRACGPDFGRILIGKTSKSAGRRADFEAFPIKIWPKSGPKPRFPGRKHFCVT